MVADAFCSTAVFAPCMRRRKVSPLLGLRRKSLIAFAQALQRSLSLCHDLTSELFLVVLDQRTGNRKATTSNARNTVSLTIRTIGLKPIVANSPGAVRRGKRRKGYHEPWQQRRLGGAGALMSLPPATPARSWSIWMGWATWRSVQKLLLYV
ncbi:MAG TPA: hypothetical protein VNU48_00905 [Burkholderiaceae bacterium]|nr:hypothetical protein [Burkholderiaceae bacterium]